MIRDLVYYPNPVLSTPADFIEDPTAPEIQELAQDLLDTVAKSKGVGLAAPQIGVGKRICVCYLERSKYWVLINPIIRLKGPEVRKGEEGCLSLPGIGCHVTRPTAVLIEYHDLEGEQRTMEATNFDATIIQHEMDHLDGILMWDHARDLKQKRLKQKFMKKQKRRKL